MQYRDVEVFEVGKEQLWGWCHWRGRYVGLYAAIGCNADSLSKGRYVVVERCARFGKFERMSHIYFDYGCLRDAVACVRGLAEADTVNIQTGFTDEATDYEIWHIVDDSELWDEWERRATECATVTDSDLGESEYRCPECAARYDARPCCVLCGDDAAGPWLIYRGKDGALFYVCEDCKDTYENTYAAIEGARLV